MAKKFKIFDNNKLLYIIIIFYIILAFFCWKKLNENYETKTYHLALTGNFHRDYAPLFFTYKPNIFVDHAKFNVTFESIIDALRYKSQFFSYSVRNEFDKKNLCDNSIELSIGKEHQIRFDNVFIFYLKSKKKLKNELFNECIQNYKKYINYIYNLLLLENYEPYSEIININLKNSENQVFFSTLEKLIKNLKAGNVEMIKFKLKENVGLSKNYQVIYVFFIISFAFLYLIISIKNRKIFNFNKLIIKKFI